MTVKRHGVATDQDELSSAIGELDQQIAEILG